MDLLELRKEIDEIDDELIPLLLKRMSVSEKVAKYKVERGMPVGVGANIFSTVESHISSSLFGVPAVKGVEFGAGFDLANMTGYEANDTYSIKNGKIFVNKNNNGGILGGMTTGAPIIVKAAIKPTPSISKPQKSVNLQTMTEEELVIHGRHDPCIVPRALPVIESAVAFALLDLMA